MMILQLIGCLLFFACTTEFEELLPTVDEATHSVVILRLSDHDKVGSTFIRATRRFAKELPGNDNKRMVVGIGAHVWKQLEKTDRLDFTGEENIFLAEPKFSVSLDKA